MSPRTRSNQNHLFELSDIYRILDNIMDRKFTSMQILALAVLVTGKQEDFQVLENRILHVKGLTAIIASVVLFGRLSSLIVRFDNLITWLFDVASIVFKGHRFTWEPKINAMQETWGVLKDSLAVLGGVTGLLKVIFSLDQGFLTDLNNEVKKISAQLSEVNK